MPLDASSYTLSYNSNERVLGTYRAIFIIIDSPQALEDSLALVANLRSCQFETHHLRGHHRSRHPTTR
jgi:two-component system OmpR family response regulator